jgi:hypothetical protein
MEKYVAAMETYMLLETLYEYKSAWMISCEPPFVQFNPVVSAIAALHNQGEQMF